MSTLPFLLEIGTEEIPDWMIGSALDDLKESFQQLLAKNNIGENVSVALDATPRRLTLRAAGVAVRQADSEELVMGPPKSAAFKDGVPTGAALGFARKMGVEVADLKVESTPKGEYLAYLRKIEGKQASQILSDALSGIILQIHFPKTMYWTGKDGPRFIRPIRWLVALLGEEVVPFELAGVSSGRTSNGHRILSKQPFDVTVDDYAVKLKKNGVVISAEERRKKIQREIKKLLGGAGPRPAQPDALPSAEAVSGQVGDLPHSKLRLRPDPELLNTLVYITEFPTPILGSFDPQYLALPQEVLVTVMRHHQKYFSVEDADGKLAPHFIAVMNTKGDPKGLVRQGNERVLRARFNDARFFWQVDQHKKLAERVPDLAHVTYQAKLGSYLDKTERVIELTRELAKLAQVDPALAGRAAQLSKCDLTTEMVKEFTELQGVVGGLYAREQGEPEEVAQAIYEHYKPVSMEDSIPGTICGRLVSLADKLDALRGCFRVGLIPSGSRDPFALRRAAQGVVKILVEGKLPLPLAVLLGQDQQLKEFLLDRIRYYFKDVRGFKYDEVNAAVAAGFDDLVDLESRLSALQAVRPTPDFEPLAASFKRIRNILVQAQFTGGGLIDAQLLEPGPEAELHAAFLEIRQMVESHRAAKDYPAALTAIAALRPKVDLFFDKVLVNAPDARVRQNRLALVASLLTEFSAIADFSEIVTVQ
jgi:glycyl-tRNA synthetase beta chain